MTWAPAQAGNRASKTRPYLRWWDSKSEQDVVTSTTQHMGHSTFLLYTAAMRREPAARRLCGRSTQPTHARGLSLQSSTLPPRGLDHHPLDMFHAWSYGVTVSTLDSESSDRGSNPRRTSSYSLQTVYATSGTSMEKGIAACARLSMEVAKKLVTLLDLCVSSLRRGHANLLCIVPILTDDPRRESGISVLRPEQRRLGPRRDLLLSVGEMSPE